MDGKTAWWQKNPLDYYRFKNEIKEFESLKIEILDTKVFIKGIWAVYGETSLITQYNILIEILDDYPNSVPKVFETGCRIPKEADYHINLTDNSACLFAPPERFEKWPIGAGIKQFLTGPVKEFFFSQAFKELGDEWPFGEWSHGNEGILEYYASRLGVTKAVIIAELLEIALSPKFYRQWKCPCGSKKRLIACHGERIKKLRELLPTEEIKTGIKIAWEENANGIKDVKLRTI
jgi:hypothetical protein